MHFAFVFTLKIIANDGAIMGAVVRKSFASKSSMSLLLLSGIADTSLYTSSTAIIDNLNVYILSGSFRLYSSLTVMLLKTTLCPIIDK